MGKAKRALKETIGSITTARELSTIERAKALDRDFKLTVEGIEKTFGDQVESYLDITINSLMDRMTRGEEKVSINETVAIANQLRKLLKDRNEARQKDIVLSGVCPDKSTKQPCARCPRCASLAVMSYAQLEKRITDSQRHLNLGKI